jgi:hypothetical protein
VEVVQSNEVLSCCDKLARGMEGGSYPGGREAVTPWSKSKPPRGPRPPLSQRPQVPLPCIDPCVFAFVLERSLCVTAPPLCVTAPAVTSIYSSCGPAMTRSARVELRAGPNCERTP